VTKRGGRDRSARAEPVDLSGRSVIVTGASPGSLGFATARVLATWGANVVISTRAKAEDAAREIAPGVRGRTLDLTDASSVAAFARWYRGEHERLDVLVNNAGVHLDLRSTWTEPHLTPDGYEIHWRTNYLGTLQLTHLLLPLLTATARQQGEARVVNVVSKLHVRGRNEFLFAPLEPYNSWNAYGQSKLALIHASNEIARRYEDMRAYSVHPGSVYSHIADKGLDGHRVLAAARKALAPIERRMLLSPEQGAQTTVHCATAPVLESGYYRACELAPASGETHDRDVSRRLWDETEQWATGLMGGY